MNEFVHLRVHSEYSLVDSIIDHKSMVKTIQEGQMLACAITDNSNLFGTIKQYKSFLAAGIKPIFGIDVVFQSNDEINRLILLAENNDGYENIVKLISDAYLSHSRDNGIPIIDEKYLENHCVTGVICISCAIEGHIRRYIDLGEIERATEKAQYLQDIFGENNFFIELQRVGKQGEANYIQNTIDISFITKIPLLVTNDVRFIKPDDYIAHEIRVGIHNGYTMLDKSRSSNYTEQQYFKSREEMNSLFSDIPSALRNTFEVAKRCNVTFELGRAILPKFQIPEHLTENQYFSEVSYIGLENRLKVILKKIEKKEHDRTIRLYKERLDIEISVISEMGFSGYFLIVADFIKWSKLNSISVGPGRGSGAGSLVAYVLAITNIDPIPYGLLFERFLNPERVSMPDFDIDFCINGRDKVVDYVAQKYGRKSVSQIITYGTMAAKAVIRDVGRVLGHPYGFVDRIAKLIPNELGIKLKDASRDGTPLHKIASEDEAVEAMLKLALKLEGTVRNVGKHAAGVVISPSLVTDFSPIYCEEGSQQLITQFDKYDVEEAGLVKFDFLGLRNLTVIDNAIKYINLRKHNKELLDIDNIPLSDTKTFSLLQNAKTTGIFQLESKGMKELILKLRPDSFEDIIALVALYRPGPLGSGMVDDFVNCKHGRQKVSYPHPKLEKVLRETYGTILYQEQVMQIAQVLASYSLGSADILRRAMGKKNPAEMASQRQGFILGCTKNGIDSNLSESIFDLMEEFAKYGFNKSHSAAYALVSYQTAWLKAHYPAEFMAALLSSDMEKTDKVNIFVNECLDLSINVLKPHINHSNYDFSVSNNNEVIYGLGAIKGIGESVIHIIVAERNKAGVYKDIFDLCRRIEIKKINKRVLEALVYSGALDMPGICRSQIFSVIPDAIKAAVQIDTLAKSKQEDLFGLSDSDTHGLINTYPSKSEWGIKEKLTFEKSVLGMHFSGHMIDSVKTWIPHIKHRSLSSLEVTHRKVIVRIIGAISRCEIKKTKKGAQIGIFEIDDSTSKLDMLIFNPLLETVKGKFQVDDIVVIEAEVGLDSYSEKLKIVVQDMKLFSEALNSLIVGLTLYCDIDVMSQSKVSEFLNNFTLNSNDKLEKLTIKMVLESKENDYNCDINSSCFVDRAIEELHSKLLDFSFIQKVGYDFK